MLTKKSKRSKGFTLVELLVTIAILAVLATVSVVGYISFIEKSAVSTDNYLVTQLNDLARLYEIEHTGSFEESDVRKLVKNAGITSLELKSESYDYRLYFNQNNNKFILTTEDYSNDEKYLLIDDGFLSKNDDDDVVGDDENKEENNPGEVTPPAGGDQEPEEEGESNSPEIREPDFYIEKFGKIPSNYKAPCFYSIDNVIYVGVAIETFGQKSETSVDFSKIKVYEANNATEDREWIVTNYAIDNTNLQNPTNYYFTSVGYFDLSLTVNDPENPEIEKTVNLTLQVRNTVISDAIIYVDKCKSSATSIYNGDNTYSYEIVVMDGIEVFTTILPHEGNDYETSIVYQWNASSINNIKQEELLENIYIAINIDGTDYMFDKTMLVSRYKDGNKKYNYYYAILDGLTSSTLPENSYITYYYQGGNGVWVASDPVYIS